MSTTTVQNESGQVVSFTTGGPLDPREQILRQRIKSGELSEVSTGTTSERVVSRARRHVVDADTGVTDEKGDLLKSIHGGGLDPDAAGDALGQPTGSGRSSAKAKADKKVAVDYVERVETVETTVETTSPTK